MKPVVLFGALLLPTTSWAEASVDVVKTAPSLAIGTMIASLLLVIACIFLFAFLMKKSNLLHNGRGKALIKVIATQPLTNKGRVQIIEVNQKRYLIAVTEQNINLLDTFAIPEEEEVDKAADKDAASFSTLLSKISIKRNE